MFQARSTLTSPPNCHGTACRASSAKMRNSSCPVTADLRRLGLCQREGPAVGFQAGVLLCRRFPRLAGSRIPGRSFANELGNFGAFSRRLQALAVPTPAALRPIVNSDRRTAADRERLSRFDLRRFADSAADAPRVSCGLFCSRAIRPSVQRSRPARSRSVRTSLNPAATNNSRTASPCSSPCSTASQPPWTRWCCAPPITTRSASSPVGPENNAAGGSKRRTAGSTRGSPAAM